MLYHVAAPAYRKIEKGYYQFNAGQILVDKFAGEIKHMANAFTLHSPQFRIVSPNVLRVNFCFPESVFYHKLR